MFKLRIPSFGDIVRRLIISWMTAVNVGYILLPGGKKSLDGTEVIGEMLQVSLPIILGVCFILLFLADFLTGNARISIKYERIILAGDVCLFSLTALFSSFTLPFMLGCAAITFLALTYARFGWNGADKETAPIEESRTVKNICIIAAAVLTLIFFVIVAWWTVARVLCFSTPTYDFGIFAQMFHSMKTTGLPVTTLERAGELSHFAVHVSPIYYIILPFYFIFPHPATLQIAQAAILASAVIPLWKICTLHGLNSKYKLVLTAIMLAAPLYAGGVSYDIHENAFLTPLILWLFYGIDRKNLIITIVAALLTLSVKEDAAVYVAVIALFLIVSSLPKLKSSKRNLIVGCSLMLAAVAWFLAATWYLDTYGDGVMTYRYDNLMYGDSDSLLSVIIGVLVCPMKALFECFDAEKGTYILATLLPLGGLTFMTRRYERFILFIPYILVNLMSDYVYQHDIFFQYSYGSFACLIYLTAINLSEIKVKMIRTATLTLALTVSIFGFTGFIMPRANSHIDRSLKYEAVHKELRETLAVIPDDASVATTTFYSTPLSRRDTVYDIKYASEEQIFSCDYIAIGVGDTASYQKFHTDAADGYEAFLEKLAANGYELISLVPDKLAIYIKTE